MPKMTIHNALLSGRQTLSDRVPLPDLEARVLLGDVLEQSAAFLLAHPEHPLTDSQNETYRNFLQQRANGTPLAYVRGQQEFFGRSFIVKPGVLIPRPATELLIQAALHGPSNIATVADVGCGSGCIACTLALERPMWRITAIDPSPIARAVTTANVTHFQLGARVHVQDGDLLSGVDLPDLVIANLPYLHPAQLTEASIQTEPLAALDGGDDGLALIRRLIEQIARQPKRPTGLILECDQSQVPTVQKLVDDHLRPTQHRLLSEEAVRYGLEAWWY